MGQVIQDKLESDIHKKAENLKSQKQPGPRIDELMALLKNGSEAERVCL